MIEKTKVLAYIYRDFHGKKEILVFDHVDHPEAGTQVPGGTVEAGEDFREALLREIIEEAGLVFHIVDVHLIGQSRYQRQDNFEINHRHYYQIEGSHLEDEWTHQVESKGDDHGLRFRFYWLTIEEAQKNLVGKMHECLGLLF